MPDIKAIADRADIIVNGYAFEQQPDGIHVLNLNHIFSKEIKNLNDYTKDCIVSIALPS